MKFFFFFEGVFVVWSGCRLRKGSDKGAEGVEADGVAGVFQCVVDVLGCDGAPCGVQRVTMVADVVLVGAAV